MDAAPVRPHRTGDAHAAPPEALLIASHRSGHDVIHAVWDTVAGVRVRGHVNDRARAGDGGPHVVLVHGLGMAANYLEPAMRALGDRIAASALDLPGFGKSRVRGPHLSLAELADALIEWMRVRGIHAPILLGQSHGCQVILEAVARNPDLAAALVLNAPTMLAGSRRMSMQLWHVVQDTPREPFALVPHVARDYLRAGPSRIIGTLRDALYDRIEDKLPHVAVPVTIMCGAHDPVAPPAWGAQLARLTGSRVGAAEAKFVVIPGAAHAAPFSHPTAIATEIEATGARLDRARARP